MRRLFYWLWALIERLLGRYYEGPEPPRRLGQATRSFAKLHPGATVGEWVRFAETMAAESYRSGYIRGLEHRERDLVRAEERADLGRLEAARHDWNWSELGPSDDELASVVESNRDVIDRMQPEMRALVLDSIGRHMGTHRVVVVPKGDPKAR